MSLFNKHKNKKSSAPIEEFVTTKAPIHYTVLLDELSFDPSSEEVIYYNPGSKSIYDTIIAENLEDIDGIFSPGGKRFVYLPRFNEQLQSDLFKQQVEYQDPHWTGDKHISHSLLSYSDIQRIFHIPEDIKEPCLVRCMTPDSNRELHSWAGTYTPDQFSLGVAAMQFSICILESTDKESFLSELRTYLKYCYSPQVFYSLITDKEREERLAGKSADERFEEDVYVIGREIRDRVEQLKSKGLSSFAIKQLIGNIDDSPSPLTIDKHNKILLPGYNNKEIKLSPIHKAVFFLFLKHPEGIYFKDLPAYREELGDIYGSISGRDDPKAIEESLDKLTNPYDNSINEKCARIKNAFVSEFREGLAEWYFIDGKKGEKKRIILPRELVTWEVKD